MRHLIEQNVNNNIYKTSLHFKLLLCFSDVDHRPQQLSVTVGLYDSCVKVVLSIYKNIWLHKVTD